MKIRSATITDRKQLSDLWHDCFSDPFDYIDFYFDNRFSPEFCAVLEDEGEIVGMIHLLPCVIHPNEKALYWYAAGIRSDRRKEGLFRKFASEVKDKVNLADLKNVCVPAAGLEKIYQNLGFANEYRGSERTYKKSEKAATTSVEFLEADSNDFISMKKNQGDLCWSNDAIHYAIAENNYCNGKALKFEFEQTVYCFFAILKDEKEYLIENHNIPLEIFEKIKESLFEYLNCNTLTVRDKGDDMITGLADSSLISENSKISMNLA